MVRRMEEVGHCRLCGIYGPLSFEHVPPRKAFNGEPVLEADVNAYLSLLDHPGAEVPLTKVQGGAGDMTLCERCNNETGSWYGPHFVKFARQAMKASKAIAPGAATTVTFDIRPLPVLKQVLTMFCSACGPGLTDIHPQVRQFLLQKEPSGLHLNLRLFAGLFNGGSPISRQAGVTGRLDLGGTMERYAEIAFPPFVFQLTIETVTATDPRLVEISAFAASSFREQRTINLRMYSLIVDGHLPGVYKPLT